MEKDSEDNSKKENKKAERRIEKELLWILAFITFLVVLFFVASAYFKSFNVIKYEGLSFTKEQLGEIPVYHYYYYFENKQGGLIKYNLYLRNDPSMNDVPVEGDVNLEHNRVFLSVDTLGLKECPQSILAVAGISAFLRDNQFNVLSGNPNFYDAGSENLDWVTCENKKGENIVIILKEGDETKINIDGRCHTISVANCEVLEAVEKYEVQSIVDAKKS